MFASGVKAESENESTEIGVLGQVANVLLHVFGIDLDVLAGAVGCRK